MAGNEVPYRKSLSLEAKEAGADDFSFRCGGRRKPPSPLCGRSGLCGADGRVIVENLHSPLLSVGGHFLYGDYRELPVMEDGFAWCLYNNKWGTNFKMWCEDDCTFEYVIDVQTYPGQQKS